MTDRLMIGTATAPSRDTAADDTGLIRGTWPIAPRPVRRRRLTRLALAVVAVATLGFLVDTVALARNGILVDDEGWYLQAARAVAHGQLPYRDFAFTQGPLAPYVFAPGQWLTDGSLLAGRITAAVIAVLTFAVAVRSAWRVAGPAVGAALALVAAADTGTAWSMSMAKTYGITALCLVGMTACLVSRRRPERLLPWAVALTGLAATARFSALAAWAVVSLLGLLVARSARSRTAVAAAALVPMVTYGSLYLLAPAQTRFGLWGYHQLTVSHPSLRVRLDDLLVTRLPDVVTTYTIPLLAVALAGAAALAVPGALGSLRRRPGPVIAGAGLLAFMVANFAAGEWHSDYLMPAAPALFLLAAVAAGAAGVRSRATRPAVAVLVAGCVVAGAVLLRPGWGIGLDQFPGTQTALERTQTIAARLAEVTGPDAHVLALHGAAAAVEAGRDTVPGDSLAQFSYIDTPTHNARRLGVLNADMLRQLVQDRIPDAVLLSDWDIVLLGKRGTVSDQPGDARPFMTALEQNYRAIATQAGYGQGESTLTLYVRR